MRNSQWLQILARRMMKWPNNSTEKYARMICLRKCDKATAYALVELIYIILPEILHRRAYFRKNYRAIVSTEHWRILFEEIQESSLHVICLFIYYFISKINTKNCENVVIVSKSKQSRSVPYQRTRILFEFKVFVLLMLKNYNSSIVL